MENSKLSQTILKIRHLKSQLDFELRTLYGQQVKTRLIIREVPPPFYNDIVKETHFKDKFTTATTTKLLNFNYMMIEDSKKVKGFMAWNEIPEDDDLMVIFTNN